MSENDPACKDGDAGLQAEDKGGYGGVHVFLADDLQGVGNTAGHDACIEDGQPCGTDGG